MKLGVYDITSDDHAVCFSLKYLPNSVNDPFYVFLNVEHIFINMFYIVLDMSQWKICKNTVFLIFC